jgi:hypothetical protein
MIWENVSLLDEVVRLLEIVLQGKDPLILLFPNPCEITATEPLKLIDALSARPIAASSLDPRLRLARAIPRIPWIWRKKRSTSWSRAS